MLSLPVGSCLVGLIKPAKGSGWNVVLGSLGRGFWKALGGWYTRLNVLL